MITTLEQALEHITDLTAHPRRIYDEQQPDWRLAKRLYHDTNKEELTLARITYEAGMMYGTQEHALFIIGQGIETTTNKHVIFGASTWHPPQGFGQNNVQPYDIDRIKSITLHFPE